MPIKDLQKRLTQVGVIRLGGPKTDPRRPGKRLETFRFTSPSKALIDAVASLYGGTVQPWQSPSGPQWEVISGASEIPVMVPPQRIDPNYELWGNGFRARMCDGETERIRNVACLCSPEKRECKPTTRMSLMLAEVPSLGTFRLESHGWNAAAELPMLAESIEAALQPIPARLEIQARQKKELDPSKPADKQILTKNFLVPVLHFDFVTPAQAFGGQIAAAARNALAPAQRQAIAAEPEQVEATKLTPERVLQMAPLVRNVKQLQDLWKDAAAQDALTDEVKSALTARAEEVKPKPAEPSAEPEEAPGVVDVDVVEGDTDEPDPDAVWMLIQAAAHAKGWNADAIEERVIARFNRDSGSINGWQMQQFLDAIKAGEIS